MINTGILYGTNIKATIHSEEYLLNREDTKKFLEISEILKDGKTIELNVDKINFETLDGKKNVLDVSNVEIRLK